MLILDTVFGDFFGPLLQSIDTIFLYINAAVYNLMSFFYQIFIAISSARIFTTDQYQNIASRIYIVVSVVALFAISYGLLRAIINPDEGGKSKTAPKNMVINMILAVVLIAVVPTIFRFVYNMQEVVIDTNIIPRLIKGEDYDNSQELVSKDENGSFKDIHFEYAVAGQRFSNDIFTSFLYPLGGECGEDDDACIKDSDIETTSCYFGYCRGANAFLPSTILEKLDDYLGKRLYSKNYSTARNKRFMAQIKYWMETGNFENTEILDMNTAYNFEDAKEDVANNVEDFTVYANFGDQIHGEEKKLEYHFIFQLIAGIFVIYVLLNFCIDIAVRAVKLGYYQIIAPIPILTLLVPNQKKVFDSWLKATISTYIDIFVRIAVIAFGLLLIENLPQIGDSMWETSLFVGNKTVQGFARVFIIIGILIFIKQAPKLITDIFGLQVTKLGIKDRLGEMAGIGGLAKEGLSRAQGAATGALGAGWSSMMNGGGFLKGAKYGVASGWRDGANRANQFNAQRQKIYSDAMGRKGKAGWFGKQSAMDKWLDDTRDKYSDYYKDQVMTKRVNEYTNIADPNSKLAPVYEKALHRKTDASKKQLDELNNEMRTLSQNGQNVLTNLDNRIEEGAHVWYARRNEKAEELKNSMRYVNAGDLEEIVEQGKAFKAEKDAKIAKLKSDEDALSAEKAIALSNAQASFEASKTNNISVLEKKITDAKASLMKKGIDIQSDQGIAEMQKQLDLAKGLNFEDSDDAKRISSEYDNRIISVKNSMDQVMASRYENTEDYARRVAKMDASDRRYASQLSELMSTKYEDTDEYKKLKSQFDAYEQNLNSKIEKIQSDIVQENGKLNERTAHIKKWAYNEETGKIAEYIYDVKTGNLFDPSKLTKDELKNLMVTQNEADAYNDALKDLRDLSEDFKAEERIVSTRVNEKSINSWLNSDEGQKMAAALGANAGKIGQGIKVEPPKGGGK